ncbi:hypothetical protein JRO89_XS15G0025000 [Xanthoceras sorbifolium]|uniref:Nephrocystin-3 n=1 Tax=Xanthoceras sorbifolium TaxID=99658 RepID=A0ABQ8H0T0_9ROSI|nr:hypothetical protein JRO89_XS15G0025000 [Xanthoceras sorbifolium]
MTIRVDSLTRCIIVLQNLRAPSMAASFLLPSPSFINQRKSRVCLGLHSEHGQKGIACYCSISIQKQKCDIKLYMVPSKAIARHWRLKMFASVDSLQADVADKENHVRSVASAPSDFQRYNTLFDRSSHSIDGMNDFEKQLEELFNEVKTMIMTGKTNDAIDLLQANYEAVKEQIDAGNKGMEEAAILDIIALGYMAIGDLKFVGSLLDMMHEVVDSLKDDEPLLDSVLMHMGSMYSALGKFKESVLVYRRVTNNLERIYGKNSTFLITPLLGLAKALGSIGRATKAIEIYHLVISILESNRGAESEDLVLPLFGLGKLLIKEGKATDAESAFVRILEIYTKIYGENDGRVGMAMCSLAHAKCAKGLGNADEAVDLYKNALQVIKDSDYMALDDSIMENMRIDLAELLHIVGRSNSELSKMVVSELGESMLIYGPSGTRKSNLVAAMMNYLKGKEGRELLEECLLITERYKGKEHPSSVTHLLNLATSYSRSKNFVEAERLLRTSLMIMKKTLSPDDPSITFPMLHLGVTLYHLNQDEEAEQIVLEVLRTREKAFGKDSLPVVVVANTDYEFARASFSCPSNVIRTNYQLAGEALDCLVSIQTRLGKEDAELLELLKRVLSVQEKEFGNESEEVMVTLKKVVFYLDKLGIKDEKFPFQKRLSILKNKFKQKVQY